jgi:hypothetical protein
MVIRRIAWIAGAFALAFVLVAAALVFVAAAIAQ